MHKGHANCVWECFKQSTISSNSNKPTMLHETMLARKKESKKLRKRNHNAKAKKRNQVTTNISTQMKKSSLDKHAKASIPSSPISFIYHFSTPNLPKASCTPLNHLLYYFNYTHCSNSSGLSTKKFGCFKGNSVEYLFVLMIQDLSKFTVWTYLSD